MYICLVHFSKYLGTFLSRVCFALYRRTSGCFVSALSAFSSFAAFRRFRRFAAVSAFSAFSTFSAFAAVSAFSAFSAFAAFSVFSAFSAFAAFSTFSAFSAVSAFAACVFGFWCVRLRTSVAFSVLVALFCVFDLVGCCGAFSVGEFQFAFWFRPLPGSCLHRACDDRIWVLLYAVCVLRPVYTIMIAPGSLVFDICFKVS